MKSIILLLVISFSLLAQTNPLKSPENIRLFADYLYCDQDYLRAAEEYQLLDQTYLSDTIIYKIAKCYSLIGENDKSLNYFYRIQTSSFFYDNSKKEIGKIYFLRDDEISLDRLIDERENSFADLLKLKFALSLKKNINEPDVNKFLFYDDEDFKTLKKFYHQKSNPGYKSELLAGILSTIIPGSGKIYTEEYGDGITAFILTGLFSYLAYDNFKHNHDFRGYLFSGIATGFYLGNIYGSVASAQIFNVKVDYTFLESLSDFLIKRNYFVKEYEFCK